MGGDEGDDGSGLEREIDQLVALPAGDEEQAVIPSAMFTLRKRITDTKSPRLAYLAADPSFRRPFPRVG
jgi:hypothetical protein